MLKKTDITMRENDNVMEIIKTPKSNQNGVVHHCLYLLVCSLKLKHNHISRGYDSIEFEFDFYSLRTLKVFLMSYIANV